MSHVATIECQIKSLIVLKKACSMLGLEFMEDKKTYKWYGRHVGDYPLPEGMKKEDMGKCLHAIKVPGANYEVGVIKDPADPKVYKLIWDFYDKSLIRQLGENAWKLTQRYTMEQSKLTARLKGKTFREIKMKDRMRLVVDM
jgi:hypothetical protein